MSDNNKFRVYAQTSRSGKMLIIAVAPDVVVPLQDCRLIGTIKAEPLAKYVCNLVYKRKKEKKDEAKK